MPAEDRYEAGWARCRGCDCMRPRRLLDANRKCSDNWRERLAWVFVFGAQVDEMLRLRRVSPATENAEGK